MTLPFPTRPVTIDCVVFNDDAVVLIKRGHEPFKDQYALPGGFVELTRQLKTRAGVKRWKRPDWLLEI